MNIKTVIDSQRGCGWRKPGGLYLISAGLFVPCGRLPIPLDRCPTCDAGIKPSRGWTWLDAQAVLAKAPPCRAERCRLTCPMNPQAGVGKVGLLWVGEKFYPTPQEFTTEAAKLGVSRRIHTIPRGFTVGQTWVWFAHRLAVPLLEIHNGEPPYGPGIFHAFCPTEIQYVVKGDETEEQLAALTERGITPVKVVRDVDQPELAALAAEKN